MINLIKIGSNTDGAESEEFASIIEDIFFKESDLLFNALSKSPKSIESIASYSGYSVYDTDREQLVLERFETFLTGDELSSEEKESVKKFIQSYFQFVRSNFYK